MADLEISIWDNIYDSSFKENRRVITIPELLEMVKSNEYKIIIEKIRLEFDKEKRSMLKTMLPAVTVSGTFRERKAHGLIKHSGFICMDFDDLGIKTESIKAKLVIDKYVYGYFLSASGRGLAVIVRIDAYRHLESFEALERYFYEQYGLVADSGGKDVCRLRFLSYDPNAYLNTASFVFNKFPKTENKPKRHYVNVPATKTDIGKIVTQAIQKQIDITDGSYAEWQRLAASLATLGELGRDYFHALSQYHPKYDYVQANKKFDNFLSTALGTITIGTFFYFARRAGLETNTIKARKIVEICQDIKKRKDNTVEKAINQLKEKHFICIDKEDENANNEDIELVKQVYENIDISEVTGIQEIENYILENWKIRRNEITNQLEYEENGNCIEDKDFSEIYIETKKQFSKVSKNDVCDLLNCKAFNYNPLKNFIETNRYLITEGKTNGMINVLSSCIISDTGLSGEIFDTEYESYFITKWFVGMIASIYGHVSPLLLALIGRQNVGKSFFLNNLLPSELKKYKAQIKLGNDKDSESAMTKYLLILDDELSGKSRMEESHLKELTSKGVFTFRPPYGKTSIHRKRLSVLCGTTNDDAVLGDSTGNRRIITIKIFEINKDLYNSIDKTMLFMEAVRLYELGYSWELTDEDIERLNKNTVQHIAENFERELIQKFFTKPETELEISFAKFMTTTDIMLILEEKTKQKLRLRKIGLELRMLKYDRISKRKEGGIIHGYMIIPKNEVAF